VISFRVLGSSFQRLSKGSSLTPDSLHLPPRVPGVPPGVRLTRFWAMEERFEQPDIGTIAGESAVRLTLHLALGARIPRSSHAASCVDAIPTDQCCGVRSAPESALSEMPLLSIVCPNTLSNWAAAFSHAALAMTSVVCA
jgi:hypothetical protein